MKNSILQIFIFALLISGCSEPNASNSNTVEPIDKKAPQQGQRFLSQLDSLNAKVSANPRDFDALIDRGEYFLNRSNFQSAGIDIKAAFKVDSLQPHVRYLKGKWLLAVNRSRKAKREWEVCNQLDEKNIGCRIELAKLYLVVQEFDKALNLVNEVIAIDNQNYQGYYYKGLLVRDLKQDTVLALQYFQKSVDLNPEFVDGLDMMGVTLASFGDTMAKFYYQRILEMEPNRADVYYKLGVYYMNRDETNKALRSYTKAVQLDPDDADSYFNMGFMHIQLRDFQTARNYFSKAIQTKQPSYKAYYGRGYTFEMLGDVINAQNDYRKAIKANPIYTPAKEGLARVKAIINKQKK
jgi:tetratricopeptide (TPR) repeat protein